MKLKFAFKLLCFYLLPSAFCLRAPAQGTAFTYQGRLSATGSPANGIYDLRFTIYDSTNNPGVVIAGPLNSSAIAVSNGLFAVTLDFGAGVFTGPDRWLEIAVRTNGAGSYATLGERQKLTPTPYAIFAGNSAASATFSGPIALSQLPPSVALLNSNQVFTGAVLFSNPSNSFAGNGAGLAGVRFSTLDGSGIESLRYGNLLPGNYFTPTSTPVATGDMNGDGLVDLICIDTAGTVLVLTNNRNSGFTLLASNSVAASVYAADAVDINGDGRLDVVTISAGSVVALTNTGNGTLAIASSSPAGAGARAIAAADFNGDGRPDVVTAESSALTVLTNNGNAGFGLFATLTGAGPNIWDVIAADVNGDHRPDVICSQLSQSLVSGNLTVFTNGGGTGFVLASTPAVGVNPLQIAAADFNGDSHIDLVSADYGAFGAGNTISVLINDGTGNFNTLFQPSVGAALGPSLVATGDLNDDGKVDVICANSGANSAGPWSVSVLTNDGSGLLGLSTTLANQSSTLTADVNADGRLDIISSILATNGNLIVSVPDVWLDSPFGIAFHIPVTAESGLVVNGVAVLNNPGNTFNGTYTGNGAGLTGLNAGNISSGTLSDSRLSANVALRAGGNTFTGSQSFNGQIRLDNVNGFSQSSAGNFAVDAPFIIGGRVMVLTNGNVGLGTNVPNQRLVVAGNIYATGTITPNSDRNLKTGFEPVSPTAILEKVSQLPIQQWRFKSEATAVRHIGPMAQDFQAAFGLGEIPTAIATVDADGVALAAIQGLNEKVEGRSQKAESSIRKLEAENAELKQRLEALEKIIQQSH